MNRGSSIQTSILMTVTASLALLAVILIVLQSRYEYSRMIQNTNELVSEQISLTVNQLDSYRVLDQVPYIAKTVYQLERVDGVNIYDQKCALISKRPMNFKSHWDCDLNNVPSGKLVYKSENSISISDGAPRYILAKVRYKNSELFSWNNLGVAFVTFGLILITILSLVALMRKRILQPLEGLNKIISRPGILKRESADYELLPKELKPIYERVLDRDDVIQQSKEDLLKKREAEVMAQMSQQVAHDIRFPIMVLRDKLLQSKDRSEKIYSDALNDLEQLTGQLLENTSGFVKEVDLVGLVSSVVEMKQVEYRNTEKTIKIKFIPFVEGVKVSLNPTRFKFILSNLINNAKEALPKNIESSIQVIVDMADQKAVVRIKDHGIGIGESHIEQVFKRGVSINKPGGNGLGLSDAKQFVEKIDGSIDIKSSVGQGTEVTIGLPAISAGFQSVGAAPYDHVLIEDYKLSQLLWIDEAKERGINLVVFSSPQEFTLHQSVVKKTASIYLDSHFPDFSMKGEEWAKGLYEQGFDNIWMCSTLDVETEKMSWLKGRVSKNQPFQI